MKITLEIRETQLKTSGTITGEAVVWPDGSCVGFGRGEISRDVKSGDPFIYSEFATKTAKSCYITGLEESEEFGDIICMFEVEIGDE